VSASSSTAAANRAATQAAGIVGTVYESGTTARTGPFCKITVVTAATFSALSWANLTGSTITGVALPAGTVLEGDIASFTLTSGSVLAQRGTLA
jgi:hypothetical protein